MVRGGLFAALRCSSDSLSWVCCDPRGEYTGCSSHSLSLLCCDPRGEYTEYLDKETGTGEHEVTILLYPKNYTSPPIRYVVYSPTHCIAYMIKFLFVAADPCDPNPSGPNEVCGDAGQVATCSCDEGYVGSPPLCIPSTSKYIFISGWVENTKMCDFLKTSDRFHG